MVFDPMDGSEWPFTWKFSSILLFTMYSSSFHALDKCLPSLWGLFPRPFPGTIAMGSFKSGTVEFSPVPGSVLIGEIPFL